jgi:hypothetical protein
MVRIKFTTCPRTSAISPKFGSMAFDEAIKVSAEHRKVSTEQLEESQWDQQAMVSTKATLEQGARSDLEDPSRGFDNDETSSNNGGRLKIGAEAALAGISYDFRKSGVTKVLIASLESFARYFLKG